jgi:hypothetical protein
VVEAVKVGEQLLVNLTPHTITVILDGGDRLEIPPSGIVSRVNTAARFAESIGPIAVVRTEFTEVSGLPEPRAGVVYIGSSLTAQYAARLGRRDVTAPDTGPTAVRDEEGRIVAVRRLQTFAEE